MIGKISHGNSFGDCLDYLTRVKQDRQRRKSGYGILSTATV